MRLGKFGKAAKTFNKTVKKAKKIKKRVDKIEKRVRKYGWVNPTKNGITDAILDNTNAMRVEIEDIPEKYAAKVKAIGGNLKEIEKVVDLVRPAGIRALVERVRAPWWWSVWVFVRPLFRWLRKRRGAGPLPMDDPRYTRAVRKLRSMMSKGDK